MRALIVRSTPFFDQVAATGTTPGDLVGCRAVTLARRALFHRDVVNPRGIAMRRFLSSSRRDVADQSSAEAPRPHGRRRNAAARRMLAVLVGLCRAVRPRPGRPALWRARVSEARSPKPKPHTPESKAASVCLYNGSVRRASANNPNLTAHLANTAEALTEGEYKVGFSATGYWDQYYDDAYSLFESTRVHVVTATSRKTLTPRWRKKASARSPGG